MNRKTLQKVIDELKQEKPDLSYIRGILETIIETLPTLEEKIVSVPASNGTVAGELARTNIQVAMAKDEGEILDGIAKARLETVKSMTNIG